MKKYEKKVLAGLLSFALAFSMLPGIPYADGGSQVVYAEEAVTRPENRVWDLASDTTAVRPTLEGNTGEFDGIQIDTTVGKFSPRASDTQVNAGTVMTVPVEANSNGAVLTFRLSATRHHLQWEKHSTIQHPVQLQSRLSLQIQPQNVP